MKNHLKNKTKMKVMRQMSQSKTIKRIRKKPKRQRKLQSRPKRNW
jgi:hypothetical protein